MYRNAYSPGIMRRKRGRRALPDGERKGERLQLRLQADELEELDAAAAALQISRSEVIRRGALAYARRKLVPRSRGTPR
jgi:hypothetical protein